MHTSYAGSQRSQRKYYEEIQRAACFFSDEDRQVYLDTLGGLAQSGGVAIHAYVLMTNHVHLLLTASAQPNLSALMKRLGQRYVRNRLDPPPQPSLPLT